MHPFTSDQTTANEPSPAAVAMWLCVLPIPSSTASVGNPLRRRNRGLGRQPSFMAALYPRRRNELNDFESHRLGQARCLCTLIQRRLHSTEHLSAHPLDIGQRL